MSRPRDIGIIDTLIGFKDVKNIGELAAVPERDRAGHPISYMFKGIPADRAAGVTDDHAVDHTLAAMEEHGIAVGLVSISSSTAELAVRRHPDRFAASIPVDGNDIMGAVRSIRQAVNEFDIRAVTTFPAGTSPQLPIDDRHWYPVYATCVELGLPVFTTAGVPGPRVPMAAQRVELIDQVCFDFPELVLVMRHGAEPWVDLAVKLMVKWPNLYYSTSAFAPKHYPRVIIDYANTRGADKILYAGYYPFGLELDRIFSELDGVPFADEVWPRFLRRNAAKVLGLD
jgi:predicted TIM-barrel fold metal-dependent hydrolase